MNYLTKLLLLSILAIAVLAHCDREDPEITDFAYPPEDMLRYYDFPEGSWWAYLCINDSTVDTLIVLISEDESRPTRDRQGGGLYKNRRCEYTYSNFNEKLNLGQFTLRSHPIGTVFEDSVIDFNQFSVYMSSRDDHFNGQYIFNYPFEDYNYLFLDTIIQGKLYKKALILPNAWEYSTLPNAIVSEIIVQDIGIVKYTTLNKDTYELIQYSIN